MSNAWAGGSTRRWRQVRADILARDGHTCRLACPGTWPVMGGMAYCTSTATQVHHVHGKGRCRGCAADDPAHLVAACKACNLHVGDPGRTAPPQVKAVTQW